MTADGKTSFGDEMKKAVKQIKAAKQKTAEKQRKTEVLPSKKELSNQEGAIPSMESGQTESSGEIVLPEGFLARMKNLLEENEYEAFLSSYGQERLFSLRVNTLKTDREFFMKLVSKERASDAPGLVPVPWEQDGFYYSEKWRPGRLPWHEAGMYYIQEASAMAPAVLCGAQPGERILDLCAAPGGKSTKLAASLRGRGLLVANEIHPDRARALSANIERMGVRNAVVTNETPQRLASRFPVFFDRIVVDAPCSGEGMFRKEEEALLNWSMENVYRCAARQEEILEEAASMLRPGGTLIYSTCTFAPEENEAVIFHFLADHPEFDVEIISDLPGVDMEKWGFESGRGDWIVRDPAGSLSESSDTGNEQRFGAGWKPERFVPLAEAGALAFFDIPEGTVRLWPHRLRGEGHFATVLKKKSSKLFSNDSSAPFSDGKSADSAEKAAEKTAGAAAEKKAAEKTAEAAAEIEAAEKTAGAVAEIKAAEKTAGAAAEKHVKTGRKRPGKKEKNSGSFGRGSENRSGDTPVKRSEALKLWKEFCRDNLILQDSQETDGAPCGAGVSRFFREECLILFGDALWALPAHISGSDLDGLKVLRPGLHLGNVVRGRFEPAHALAMALRREEALRSISLPGTSPQAYAWFRGESLQTGETADLCDGSKFAETNSAGISRNENGIEDNNVSAAFIDNSPLGVSCSENVKNFKGWCLVTIDGCAAGWGKAGGNVIKNHYPKGLRKGSWYR